MTSSGGLAAARIYSIAVSGMPNALVLGFLATELAAFAIGLFEYRALDVVSAGSPLQPAGAGYDR
jgi:hypothetical protein